MKKYLLSLIALCFAILPCQNTFAQSMAVQTISPSGHIRCSTTEHFEWLKQQDPAVETRMQQTEAEIQNYIEQNKKNPTPQAVIIIPVVFHVVYANATENIADQRLFDQLTVLNQDFSKTNADASKVPAAWQGIAANTEIQFCLATKDPSGAATTGITRTLTTVSSFSTNNAVKHTAQGGKDVWDRNKYLNIWVCDLSGGILGYAQFPGLSATTDGVVIHYKYTGTTGASAPFNKGRTSTHEIGHFLSLYHIWGDDGTACTGSDRVADTPNQAGENYTCWAAGTVKTSVCTAGSDGSPASNVSPGYMWMNYMDYTEDTCLYMFTTGQKTRMTAAMNGTTRVGLKTSVATNCAPGTGVVENSISDNISLYPNPSTGEVFISTNVNIMDIKVYNAIGEVVITKKINASAGESKINLNNNPNGIYLFEMKTSEGTITKKVVINR